MIVVLVLGWQITRGIDTTTRNTTATTGTAKRVDARTQRYGQACSDNMTCASAGGRGAEAHIRNPQPFLSQAFDAGACVPQVDSVVPVRTRLNSGFRLRSRRQYRPIAITSPARKRMGQNAVLKYYV
jgi:hypothetical protein